jgi:histidyl-tRNA synthetase
MSKAQPARGMRDFLPADVRKREYVIKIIKEVYQKYGFEPLETPAVENLETLMGKYGEEGNQLIFKILERGEKVREKISEGRIKNENDLADLALRYDLTVPLARVVANYKNELPKFFRRYQIQPVWRADRPARGRFREFYQCDVDAIGSKSVVVEAEILSAICEILQILGFQDFRIRINHRELLREMLEAAAISSEKQTDALVTIDKLDKIGFENVKNELVERGIKIASATKILDLFTGLSKETDNGKILSRIADFIGTETDSIRELKQILSLSDETKIKIDASLARGLSYYTGAIMEAELTEGDFKGSIGGGGRYDGLIGMFGKEQIPACGFSLGLERIIVVMQERGMLPPALEQSPADVLVTIWNEKSIGESLKLANELRSQGLRVLVYPQADKLGKQIRYADAIKIPFVCIAGESELAENKIMLKNMQTGEQEILEKTQLGLRIMKRPDELSA